jgi:predicted Zn-dependent protease
MHIRFAAVAAALAVANCATNPVTGNPNFVMMSESQEIQVGRKEDSKVRKEYGVYDDLALQNYVNEIGQKLARASHRSGLQYQFTVVDSPQINAFALPGGYIYITRGILAFLNSEAELAAVLGHELGHVTARHSVQQLSAATAAQVGSSLLQIFVPETRGGLGDTAINLLGGALLSGYGREHELEADRLGAEYLARTGYDPQAMVSVVGVLKNQELFDAAVAKQEGREPRAYHGLFATHPDNDTRFRQVVGEAARFKQPVTRVAREEFLRKVDKMVYADSPQQGIIRNNTLYHAELGLAMQFPQGWRVKNSPDRVTAVSPRDEAMVDLRMAGPARGTPADVLRKAVGLGTGSRVTPTTINGLPAATASLNLRGLPTRVAAVFLDNNAYLIGAQARSAQGMNRWGPAIDEATMSFHAITDAERVVARPLRLRVITARPGMTFAELARTSPIGKHAEGYLRLLNTMYPAGEPVEGQALKIVE